jgi:hypothetical protein
MQGTGSVRSKDLGEDRSETEENKEGTDARDKLFCITAELVCRPS